MCVCVCMRRKACVSRITRPLIYKQPFDTRARMEPTRLLKDQKGEKREGETVIWSRGATALFYGPFKFLKGEMKLDRFSIPTRCNVHMYICKLPKLSNLRVRRRDGRWYRTETKFVPLVSDGSSHESIKMKCATWFYEPRTAQRAVFDQLTPLYAQIKQLHQSEQFLVEEENFDNV